MILKMVEIRSRPKVISMIYDLNDFKFKIKKIF